MSPVFLVMGLFQLMVMGAALSYGVGSPGPVVVVTPVLVLFLGLAAWSARRARPRVTEGERTGGDRGRDASG